MQTSTRERKERERKREIEGLPFNQLPEICYLEGEWIFFGWVNEYKKPIKDLHQARISEFSRETKTLDAGIWRRFK